MDARTLAIYDADAEAYCEEWLAQPPAADLQALWRRYFAPGAATVDVGSGSGRDVDWLNRNGYPCRGFDAAPGLLRAARLRFPAWSFEHACLPDLAGVPSNAYRNVVCETVIMHMPVAAIPAAVGSLRRLLAAEGTLYLSWRVGSGSDARDAHGRLYSDFPAQSVRAALDGLECLYDVEETSASSGKSVHRLIVRRGFDAR